MHGRTLLFINLLFYFSDSTTKAIGCEEFPTDWCVNNYSVKTFTVNKHSVHSLGLFDYSPSSHSIGIRPVLNCGCVVVLLRCFSRGLWLCNVIKQFLGHLYRFVYSARNFND